MGSHGGATAAGQTELLAKMGVTDRAAVEHPAPIRSSMEVVTLGEAASPVCRAFCDSGSAAQADATGG